MTTTNHHSEAEKIARRIVDEHGCIAPSGVGRIAERDRLESTIATALSVARAESDTAGWSQDLPAEQGWYWHWDGMRQSAPFPLSILRHGAGDRAYFVPMGQAGYTRSVECAEMGGWWKRIQEPSSFDLARVLLK